jgi:hypothetical protein
MVSPDEYKHKALEETRRSLKLSATWKPKEIYQRDYNTVHTESFTDFKNVKIEHGPRQKSLEEIAKESQRAKQQQEAVDNMCHLVRGAYGTVATMLRTFHKKPSDNVTMEEFAKYLSRNDLDKYLEGHEQRLVFDYVDANHSGSVPVRDFLKKVEEREFYGHEHNKDHTKLKDFLEFHIRQKRAEEQQKRQAQLEEDGDVPPPLQSSQINPSSSPLGTLKKSKGLENEVDRMKKALGMRTFGLDVDLEELDHVVSEVFHKLPTNESHRKYARFMHHSQLNLAAIPFYDYRSREIDRLKSRSALIDQELSREELKEEYDTLKSKMLRGSLALSQSLPSLPGFKTHDTDLSLTTSGSGVQIVRPSPLANTHARPVSAGQLHHKQFDDDEAGPNHMQPPPSPSSHGTYQVAKVQPSRLESLTMSSSDQILLPQSSVSPGKGNSKFNKRDLTKEQTTKEKSKVLVNNIDHHISKGKEFDDLSAFPSLVGGSGAGGGSSESVATGSYLDLLIEQPPPSYDGEEEFQAILSSGASPSKLVKHATASSQKKSLSKLMNRSLATQDHVSDFYTSVVHPSQSMGRSKDPSKIMRIERTDFTASLSQSSGSHAGGKRTFADKLASKDASRVGMGVNVRYYDASSDMNSNDNYSDDQQSASQSNAVLSQSMGPSSPLREGSIISSYTSHPSHGWGAEDMYRSVSSTQYPPLIYEPSQPVRREALSMAMQEAAKREYRRQERYARKQANLEVTKNRLAFTSLNAQLREMHGTQSRIEDAIRYKSSIFLGDLQAFRQQPLQRMAKRQNMDLSEKMWSGNVEKQTVGLVRDNRDFSSTYKADFDSDKLRHSDTLKGPMAQQFAAAETMRSSSDYGKDIPLGFAGKDTHSGFQ